MESHISKNDKQVLQMILDPSLPFDDGNDNKVMNETQGIAVLFLIWL